MKYGEYSYLGRRKLIVDCVREPMNEGTSEMSIRNGIRLWSATNPLQNFIDAQHELGIKSRALLLIPPLSLLIFNLCFRAKANW